jgi:hypothetical protein
VIGDWGFGWVERILLVRAYLLAYDPEVGEDDAAHGCDEDCSPSSAAVSPVLMAAPLQKAYLRTKRAQSRMSPLA